MCSKGRTKIIKILYATIMLVAGHVSSVSADPVKFSSAKEVMQRNCFGCHASWSQYSEQAWINSGIVIPQNFKDSPLTFRIKYGKSDNVLGAEDMPKPKNSAQWNSFSSADYNSIRDWVSTLQGSSGGGSGGGSNPELDHVFHSSDESIRLGDRYYVQSVLESIYGPEVTPIVTKYIRTKVSFFGGACDLKEHFTYLLNNRLTSNYMSCQGVDLLDSRASLVPPSSALREGLRIKTCTEIHVKDDRIGAVALKLGGNISSWPGNDKVTAAYKLFYPGRLPAGKVEASLLAVVDGAKQQFPSKPIEGWRYLLFTLCKSPDWQQP